MNQFMPISKYKIKIRVNGGSGSLLLVFKLFLIFLLGFISENSIFSQEYLLNSASNGLTFSTCTGKFYDSGGPSGSYSPGENYTITFCSNNGLPIKFDFISFDSRSSDRLSVYDGPNTSSPLIGQYSGTPGPFIITSSGTCLTFKFVSGALFNRPGWAAIISTFDTSPISPGTVEYCAGTAVHYSVINHTGSVYDWTIDGGTPSKVTAGPNNIDVTWDLPGGITGSIKVLERNSCGGKDSSELMVDIFSLPVPDFSGLVSQSICITGNAVFSVSAAGYNLTYQWQENGINIVDGGVYSGAQTPTLTLTAPGITKDGKLYRCIVSASCHVPFISNEVVLAVDSQAPTWNTAAGSLNRIVSCNDATALANAQALFPVAIDNTDSDVTDIIKTSGVFVAGLCPNSGSYTNTWRVTDACGNISAVYTQIITIADSQKPTWITPVNSLNRTVQCNNPAGLAAAQLLFPVATDNCDADVTNIVKTAGAFVGGLCPNAGSYTNTWSVTDACGNVSAVYSQVITIVDTQPPTWTTVAGSLNRNLSCSDGPGLAAAQALFPVAADNCDTDVTNIVKTTGVFVAGACANSGTYTNTWRVTDACGNISALFTQIITLTDTQVPTWTTPSGSLNRSLSCSDAPGIAAAQALFPVATDNCDADVTNIVKTSGAFVAGSCPNSGTYTNTWIVTDACSNVSAVYTQVITITDTQKPTWSTAVNSLNRTVQCNSAAGLTAAQLLFPVATDNCDADVTNIVKTSGAFVAGLCPNSGTYTNTWIVTDACGNVSAVYTQLITIEDTQAPTWTTAAGSLNRNLSCSDAPGIAAAQALFPVAADNCDADVTNIVKTSGIFVPGACANSGSYTNTWKVTDECSNVSAVFTQVITITDTQVPTWTTPSGSLNRSLSCSDAPGLVAAQALFPVATDNCDMDVTNIVRTPGVFVAGICPNSGTFTNTWRVTDACSNTSAVFTQVITLNDIVPPVVTGSLSPITVVGCSVSAAPAAVTTAAALEALPGGITINDGCTTDANLIVTSSDAVSGTCPIIVTRTYTINDGCGNRTSVTHVITINVNDNTPPAISGSFTLTTAEGCAASYAPAAVTTVAALETLGLTITDACTPDANLVVSSSDLSSGTCPVVITRTYNITDGCGNTSSVIHTINVDDTTPPSFTGCPGNISVNNDPGICSAVVSWAPPVITDNCGSPVVVSNHNPGDLFPAGTTIVTYTATDNCNNITVCSFNVIVTDIELPAITCSGDITKDEITGFTYATIAVPNASIADNCSVTKLQWTMNGATIATSPSTGINQIGTYNFNTGVTNVAYLISDAAGNISSCNFTVTIIHPIPLSGIATTTDIACFGESTGSVTIAAAGGSAPYEYSLDAGTYQNSDTFNGLSLGNHTITIRDGSFNTVDVPFTINQPASGMSLSTTQTDNFCFNGTSGSATATVSGGTGPFSYSWNSVPVQTSQAAYNLPAGTFTVTVTDSRGCTTVGDVTITQPVSGVTVSISKVDNQCFGGTTGSATAVGAGGTGPYSYTWNTTTVQNAATATGLAAGNYTVTVTESFGCMALGNVQIAEPAEILITETHQDASCPGEADGSVNLTITGGIQPYTVLWPDVNPAQNRTNMLPGTYRVIVTDVNGCFNSIDIEIGVTGSFDCIVIPEVITPNNDSFNDRWVMKNIDLYPDAEVLIYNRWGELIFRTKNILANPWDGTFKGKLVPTDSYHYILYLNDGSDPRSGVISVIR